MKADSLRSTGIREERKFGFGPRPGAASEDEVVPALN